MRESTSRNQVNGSTPQRLQEAMKLRNTAAVLPPPSLPKNVQLPRLCAVRRYWLRPEGRRICAARSRGRLDQRIIRACSLRDARPEGEYMPAAEFSVEPNRV